MMFSRKFEVRFKSENKEALPTERDFEAMIRFAMNEFEYALVEVRDTKQED